MKIGKILGACLVWALLAAPLLAQNSMPPVPVKPGGADPSYRLLPKDKVSIAVFDEPELSVIQEIDSGGHVVLPLLGSMRLQGRTIREAEAFLEEQFKDQEYLINPQVTVTITEYSVKQIYIFGEVRSPGIKRFPQDAVELDMVEVISMAGGFTDLARQGSVQVRRVADDGEERLITVDAEELIRGTRRNSGRTSFAVYPNDVIYVPERMF